MKKKQKAKEKKGSCEPSMKLEWAELSGVREVLFGKRNPCL